MGILYVVEGMAGRLDWGICEGTGQGAMGKRGRQKPSQFIVVTNLVQLLFEGEFGGKRVKKREKAAGICSVSPCRSRLFPLVSHKRAKLRFCLAKPSFLRKRAIFVGFRIENRFKVLFLIESPRNLGVAKSLIVENGYLVKGFCSQCCLNPSNHATLCPQERDF
ncbi:MAG: hypothetical protein IJS54_02660 [Desulfovibrio sp.]|nr:hypothetical protein [Desulfovibrio sp.]